MTALKKINSLFSIKVLTNFIFCGIISKHDFYAPVAQVVEHLTFNQRVRDSSSRRSTKEQAPSLMRRLFYVVQGAIPIEIKVSAILCYVKIRLSLFEGGMSEEFLKIVNTSAVLKIPSSEGMTK